MNRANLTYHIENQIADTEGKVAGKIYEREVLLSSGQIKALAATPQTLVAAPGSGKVIEFISAILRHEPADTAVAFVEPSTPDNMRIEYSGGQDVTAAIVALAFLDQVVIETRVIPFSVADMAITVDLYALENTALRLLNTGGEYTTGTGKLRVRTTYRIHDFR